MLAVGFVRRVEGGRLCVGEPLSQMCWMFFFFWLDLVDGA